MILEYYLHGLKWKDMETEDIDLNKGFVTFFVFDKLLDLNRSMAEYVQVRDIYFEISDGPWNKIYFNDMPYSLANKIIHLAKSGSTGTISTQYGDVRRISLAEGYVIVGGLVARCNNPHIYISDAGELAYREIETEVEPIKLMKLRKTIFDIIDLEK